jgi:two-component system, OmpR family, phosphate regulon sensor histidine kinase PhoR
MTIFKKSLLTLGLAALGFSVFFIVSILVFMNSLYYEVNTHGLKNTAKTLMSVIGKDRIIQLFENAGHTPEEIELPVKNINVYRLTLIDSKGDVLWDSHVPNDLVNHIDREEIIAALEGKEASARRNSISTRMKQIYYALPVFNDENKSIGVFRLSLSVPGFWVRISPVILPFLVFTCLLIVFAFWAIYAYSRSLSSSLGQLVKIAQTSAPLLSDPEAVEPVAQEFRSLERAMRAMTEELNFRFEQAKSQGSRLEAILNGMSEAVFAMDNALKLHLVNPKARELFALGNSEINKMTLLEATRSTELVEIAKKAISGGVPFEAELTFHKGAEQRFHVYASPLAKTSQAYENGEPSRAGAVLVLQEITRLLKLERIRKDFVANVSHELRTPIQLIKGFSETLLDSVTNKQDVHFIGIIHKNAGIMENLTNDLLILADLEDNTVNNRDMEELNVAPLISEAVSSLETQARKKQIEIIVDCKESLRAKLYGSFIIQALINLIENGIKYSHAKSKLWVSAFEEESELVFEVRDKGIGIPAEHLERIFERFYRVDKARSREAGGTGLGLSIVRHICLLHNGKAEVESRAGEGSVFRIKIPNPLLQTRQ